MKVLTPRPARSPLPLLKLALLAIGFLALLDPRMDARAEKMKPFTEGPWGTRYLVKEPEPEPAPKPEKAKDSRPFFSRILPGSKAKSDSESPYVAPPAPAAPQAPKSKSRFRAPWAKSDPAPPSGVPVEPAPAPAPAPKSNPITGLFKRGSGNDTAAADDVRFEPRDAPVQNAPPAAADSSSSSPGFLGRFKREPRPEPVNVSTPAPEAPETASESGGLLARFKRQSKSDPVPEVTIEEEPAPAPSEGGGLLGVFKRQPKSDPVPEVAIEEEPAPAPSEGGGLLARFKRQPKSDPAPEPEPEVTIEAPPEPAPSPKSGGFLARIRPGGGPEPTAPRREAAETKPKRSEGTQQSLRASSERDKPVRQTVTFADEIEPIFQSKCVRCHNRDTLHGRISLESRALAFKDTPAGPVIIPGDPESSILMQNITSSRTATKSMPPVGHNVSRREKSLIYTWIKEGANWP